MIVLPQEILDKILFSEYKNYDTVSILSKDIMLRLSKYKDYVVYEKIRQLHLYIDIMDEYIRSKDETYIPPCISSEFKLFALESFIKFDSLHDEGKMLDICYDSKDFLTAVCVSFNSKLNFCQFMKRYCEEDEIFFRDCLRYLCEMIDKTPYDYIIYPDIVRNMTFGNIDIGRLKEALDDKSEKIQKNLLFSYLCHMSEFLCKTDDTSKENELIDLFTHIKEYFHVSENSELNTIRLNDTNFTIEDGIIIVNCSYE